MGIGLAAPLANTSADQDIRHWYQKKIRGATTDEFADIINYAGQYWIILPIVLEVTALAGKASDEYDLDSGLYEWGNRSLRSIVVGAPPMVLMYALLGSSRPDRDNSHWHPFQDIHGVSGHTFMGAVPLLTAAAMTDNGFVKYPLLLVSFLTGWARINNDRHYFSQAALGWWMAYLAVESVNGTQRDRRSFRITPGCADGPGIGVLLQY